MTLLKLFWLLFLIGQTPAFAEEILVGLEPFPPLITENKGGYSVDMLREIEKISDLKFNIQIMPYNRAKAELQKKHLDLIGHTPHHQEEAEFYQYAEELDWSIASDAVLFVKNKKYFDLSLLANHKIATPFGNIDFHAALLGISTEKFTEGRLENLVTMLGYGRIDALIFSRSSVMELIQKQKFPLIYYKTVISMPSSFAVSNDAKGLRLKQKLDGLIKQLDQEKVFKNYLHYLKMPANGVVSIQ